MLTKATTTTKQRPLANKWSLRKNTVQTHTYKCTYRNILPKNKKKQKSKNIEEKKKQRKKQKLKKKTTTKSFVRITGTTQYKHTQANTQ